MEPQKITDKQIIKDKDKLFKKLFISPSFTQTEALDNYFKSPQQQPAPLLVSPDFINLLLEQSSSATRQYRILLINQILQIFQKQLTNSLLLYKNDSQSKQYEKSMLDSIIQYILSVIRTQQQIGIYIQKLKFVIGYYRISLKNISKLTQYLSKKTHIERFNCVKLKFILKLLKLYYSPKLGIQTGPEHYYYLLGSQASGIQPFQYSEDYLHFKNQLTVLVTFNCQGQRQTDCNNIVSIITEKNGQIGIKLSHKTLSLTFTRHNEKQLHQQSLVLSTQMNYNTWYRLLLVLTPTSTICYLNEKFFELQTILPLIEGSIDKLQSGQSNSDQSNSNSSPKSRNIFKMGFNLGFNYGSKKKSPQSSSTNTVKLIRQCIYGKQFFGMMSSMILANRIWKIQNLPFDLYPYGLSDWDSLIKLNRTKQIHQTVIFSCLPFCSFQIGGFSHGFDIFRKNHSIIGENTFRFGDGLKDTEISNLGGIKIILPLFYLARFYNHNAYPQLLSNLLEIILQIFHGYEEKNIIQELQNFHILQILGEHLQQINRFQDQNSLKLIYEIYQKLYKQTLKIKFIVFVLWKLQIGINSQLYSMISEDTNENKFRKQSEDKILTITHNSYSKKLLKQNDTNNFIEKSGLNQNHVKGNDIHQKQQKLLETYYGMLIKIYENETRVSLQAYSFNQIIYWIIQSFEVCSPIQSQSNYISTSSHNCCLQHYLYELQISNYDSNNPNQNKIFKESGNVVKVLNNINTYNKRSHYQYLQVILANILETILINPTKTQFSSEKGRNSKSQQHKQIKHQKMSMRDFQARQRLMILEAMKALLRAFLRKYSTCFYLMLTSVLKRIIKKFKRQPKLVEILDDENLKLLDFLAFLADRTLHPQILTDIIYLCGFLETNVSKRKSRVYCEFIVYLMRRYSLISIQSNNFSLVQTIETHRKRSFDQPRKKHFQVNSQVKNRTKSQRKYHKLMYKHQKINLDKILSFLPDRKQYQTVNNLSALPQLFNILMNLLSKKVSEDLPEFNLPIANNNGLQIIQEYYNKIATTSNKQNVLLGILSSVESYPVYIVDMISFHKFLLTEMRLCFSSLLVGHPSNQSNSENQTKHVFLKHISTIYTAIFCYIINLNNTKIAQQKKKQPLELLGSETSIYEMWKIIKQVEPLAGTYIFLQILPKMTQSMNIQHLLQMMLISQFQISINQNLSNQYKNSSQQSKYYEYIKTESIKIEKCTYFIYEKLNQQLCFQSSKQNGSYQQNLLNILVKIHKQVQPTKQSTILQICKKVLHNPLFSKKIKLANNQQIFSIDVILSKLSASNFKITEKQKNIEIEEKKNILIKNELTINEEQYMIINRSQDSSPMKRTKEDYELIMKDISSVFQPMKQQEQFEDTGQQKTTKNTKYKQQKLKIIKQQQQSSISEKSQQIKLMNFKKKSEKNQIYYSKQYSVLELYIKFVINLVHQRVKDEKIEEKNQYQNQSHKKKNYESIEKILQNLVEIIQIYILASVHMGSQLQNNLYLRYIVYYFTFQLDQLSKITNSKKYMLELWGFILDIVILPQFNNSENQHTYAQNYQQLRKNMNMKNISHVFVDDFQIFLGFNSFGQFASIKMKQQEFMNQQKGRTNENKIPIYRQKFYEYLDDQYKLITRVTFDNKIHGDFTEIEKMNDFIINQMFLDGYISPLIQKYQKTENILSNKNLNQSKNGSKTKQNKKSSPSSSKTKVRQQQINKKQKLQQQQNSKQKTQKKGFNINQYQKYMQNFLYHIYISSPYSNYGQKQFTQNFNDPLIPIINKYLNKTEKLFEQETVIQQKARIKYLYGSQCRFRKAQSQWNDLWHQFRVYNHPYGFWMAQKYNPEVYSYGSDQKYTRNLRNFKFEISQSSTCTSANPILEAKILEPWHIIQDNRKQSRKYLNSFSGMISHQKQDDQHKLQSQQNFMTDLWRNMWKIPKKTSQFKQYEVFWINRSQKAAGKLFIQNKQYLVFCYEGAKQDDTHLSFQKFVLGFNKQTVHYWEIFKIAKIRIHRYLLQYTALNLTMHDGKNLIFNFLGQNRDQFIKQLQKIQKQKLQNVPHLKLFKINKIPFFNESLIDNNIQYYAAIQSKQITEKWRRRQISNLQYLLLVNKRACRCIFDLSQYPVMPWVTQMKNIGKKQPIIRDLSKTMGGLGSEDRKKILLEKYYSHDPFNPHPPFFFGTHYSSPGVIFNYLIRLSPFSEYCKQLQGGKFDIADRLFSSLVNCWRSATEEVSDVRELIPEFYYLPQILLNIDQYNFGRTQLFETVNHVEIPQWGSHNPYFFVMQLRLIMESNEISSKLNEWIDLIFGYKQRGKQAQDSLNIYYYLTYEESLNLEDEQEDEVFQKSKEAQIMHFGQIPPQIFEKPHPPRIPIRNPQQYQLHFSKKFFVPNLKSKPFAIYLNNSITVNLQYQQIVLLKRSELQILSLQSNPCSLQKAKKITLEKSLKQHYYLLKKQSMKTIFFINKFKQSSYIPPGNTLNNAPGQALYLFVYGYLDHQYRIYHCGSTVVIDSDQFDSPITTVYINQYEQLIMIGLQNGLLIIYEIQYGTSELFMKKICVQVFPGSISQISYYDGFYSISYGNYCSIYQINRTLHYLYSSLHRQHQKVLKFFRSFWNPLAINHGLIIMTPLPCLVITDNANIKVYSINGQFIKSKALTSKILEIGRVKDRQFQDIIYILEDDKYICLTIPDLRTVSVLQLYDYQHQGMGLLNILSQSQKFNENTNKNQQIEWISNGIVGGKGWIKILRWGQNI